MIESRRDQLLKLKKIDHETKPGGADMSWGELHRYATGQARDLVVADLRRLGLGLAENYQPLALNFMERIIERKAVLYSDPPSRWLIRENKSRVAETQPQHKLFAKIYRDAGVDLALRRADAMTALFGCAFVRLYPSDSRGSVVLRLFGPHHVMRSPNPSAADILSEDYMFALRLAGDVFELFERTGDGWRVSWVDEEGCLLERQPHGESGAMPYEELPVLPIWESAPTGSPWPMVREDRLSFIKSIHALANDLFAMSALQAHGQAVFKRSDPTSRLPDQIGPGTAIEIDVNDDLQFVTPNPKMNEVLAILDRLVRYQLICEGLSPDELDRTNYATGTAAKVRDRFLLERRESQIPLALAYERDLFAAIRAVHNYHAEAWSEDRLDSSFDVDVEFGELSAPVDAKEFLDGAARALALNVISEVDIVQKYHSCSREQAIRILERVREDREQYGSSLNVDSVDSLDSSPMTDLEAINAAVGTDADSVVSASAETAGAEQPKGPTKVRAADIQATALNGAQVTSAVGIVKDVAKREIPRDSALGMLMFFFQLDEAVAAAILGSVGKTFFVDEPAQPQETQVDNSNDKA